MAKTFTLESFTAKAEEFTKVRGFEIQKNIPMPRPKGDNFKAMVRATFQIMEVGDCFEIPIKSSSSLYTTQRKEFPSLRIVTQVSEDGSKLRVWRYE